MIRFENDYTEGAHKRILNRLMETNEEQTPGYGVDEHCEKARAYIRKECDAANADVHFLVGGTQTNTTIIASILRPHQGAISGKHRKRAQIARRGQTCDVDDCYRRGWRGCR